MAGGRWQNVGGRSSEVNSSAQLEAIAPQHLDISIIQDFGTQPKKPGFLRKYFVFTHRFSQKPGFWSLIRKSDYSCLLSPSDIRFLPFQTLSF